MPSPRKGGLFRLKLTARCPKLEVYLFMAHEQVCEQVSEQFAKCYS